MPAKDRSQRSATHERGNEDIDKKRLRNRLSQRAFRRRQADRLRELLGHVDASDRPYDETVKALQDENSHLRRNLIEVQSKLARLIANMESLSGNVSTALGESLQHEYSSAYNEQQSQPAFSSTSKNSQDPKGDEADLSILEISHPRNLQSVSCDYPQLDDILPSAAPSFRVESAFESTCPSAQSPDLNLDLASNFNNLAQQLPSIWSFEYQMGTEPYANALAGTGTACITRGRNWIETNSPFSDHIHALQRLLKGKVEKISPSTGLNIRFFYHEVLMVLSLFNSLTRPDVMRWYAKTRFYHIVNLTAWQIYPCTRTYEEIHPQYRPTKLQLQCQYPTVIDWIPFPSIRDRLIQLHSANSQIDQIFCDAVSSYVVEAWMSDLIQNAPAIKAYIRVTDLVPNIDFTSPVSEDELVTALPARDAATLFSSPICSRAVFNRLSMNRGISTYKIDPAFFGSYPELYDHNVDIAAKGIPLRPDVQLRLTYPKPLDSQTYHTYRNFIDFSYDAPMCTELLAC